MISTILTLLIIHGVALMSPGPDFFFISQLSAKVGERSAFRAVLGITAGVMIWSGVALLGLHLLLERWAWLRTGMVLLGALYLAYLASLLLRSAWQGYRQSAKRNKVQSPPDKEENLSTATVEKWGMEGGGVPAHLFLKGLLTNLANPKAVAYFGSIFSMLITDAMTLEIKGLIFILIALETLLWFMLVAKIFALPVLQRGYRRLAHWIDGLTGLLFGGFSLLFLYRELKRYWEAGW